MGTIHVNTDAMRQLGLLFVNLNEQIATQIEPAIMHQLAILESDWVGVSRQHFETILQQWRSTTSQLVSNGEEIGRHLEDTAVRFETVDETA